jgi:hypothetical protein
MRRTQLRFDGTRKYAGLGVSPAEAGDGVVTQVAELVFTASDHASVNQADTVLRTARDILSHGYQFWTVLRTRTCVTLRPEGRRKGFASGGALVSCSLLPELWIFSILSTPPTNLSGKTSSLKIEEQDTYARMGQPNFPDGWITLRFHLPMSIPTVILIRKYWLIAKTIN